MNRQISALIISALIGASCAATATLLGASIQLSLPIFVGCLSGGMGVAYMKKN
ncbi:hypothetical protein PDM28_01860 [Stenotrophomonas aracearum]|uniref:Lipoprotein n=1 Tax=Stenotrophomonas aracearum TaxID=3003272 RepID=A0ABY9YE01_9GAMM|nr:hypothetical protein [Stenotrophomonas sp. A5588]WNH49105.1 hypothetical protein PDM28_01860 [Stenotrophomonas sp. A5588]